MNVEIVKVTWIDAQRLELGVIQKEEIPTIEPINCDIVGFLVDENKNRIIIAQEKWDELGGCKYVHVIPKMSILKIVRLKEIVETTKTIKKVKVGFKTKQGEKVFFNATKITTKPIKLKFKGRSQKVG